jgi:hypothetical protein
MALPANAAFAPRMVLLELYHTDNRGWAREDESKRPTGVIVSSILAAPPFPLLSAVLPHQLTHLMSFGQNVYVTTPLSLYSILP